MKYTFKCQQFAYDPFRGDRLKEPESIITIETEQETLDGLLEQFEAFLRGCGFTINGTLDVIPYDEPQEWKNEEFETPTMEEFDIVHSQHFYDKDRNK